METPDSRRGEQRQGEDERKGDAEELGKSPSIPPGDDFPSEEDVGEKLPGVPEESEDPASERGDE